ncbi:MAG TPA: hypothetical protein VFZ66_22825 [Herpetosiphonaceae bacterium]
MDFDDQHQAALLDEYTAALSRDANAIPPHNLAPEIVQMARHLDHHTAREAPQPLFAEQLRQRLYAEAIALAPGAAARSRRPRFQLGNMFNRRRLLGSVAAIITVFALVTMQFLTLRPQPVSAAEILQRAQTASRDRSIRSFVLTETLESAGNPAQGNGGFRNVTRRWYEAPNRWRIESTYSTLMPGTGEETHTAIQVSDGTTRWDYDTQQQIVTIDRVDAEQSGQHGMLAFGVTGLEAVLQEASTCRRPTLQTDAAIAGRRSYVIDLGPSTCGSSSSAPELNGRQVLWIDQQTFFVLKAELYGQGSDQPIATREISAMQYNTAIDARQFSFTPPASATVQDMRQP